MAGWLGLIMELSDNQFVNCPAHVAARARRRRGVAACIGWSTNVVMDKHELEASQPSFYKKHLASSEKQNLEGHLNAGLGSREREG